MNRDERIAYTKGRYKGARWNYFSTENPTPTDESEMHDWYKRWRYEEGSPKDRLLTITCWAKGCGFPIVVTPYGPSPTLRREPNGDWVVTCPRCESQSSSKVLVGRVFRTAGKD